MQSDPQSYPTTGSTEPSGQDKEGTYLKVGKQLLDIGHVTVGRGSRSGSSQQNSYAGQVLLEAIRREYQYARWGLALGLATVVAGTILCLHGAAGSTSWTAKALGIFESKLNDAAPGVVLFVVGVFLIVFTRPRIKLGNLQG
jgi:hypothetical protein